MSGSSFAIVWEWQLPLRTHIWVPYTTNVCQHIEKEFRNSPSQAASLNGLNVMELTDCEIDFARMRQVNTVTKESLRVRQQRYPSDCAFVKGIHWKWLSDLQWQLYDVETSNYIEDKFQQKETQVNLRRSPIRIPNRIHFSTMEQTNRRTKFSRKVQRDVTKEQYPEADLGATNGIPHGLKAISTAPNAVNAVVTPSSAVQPLAHSHKSVRQTTSNAIAANSGDLSSSHKTRSPTVRVSHTRNSVSSISTGNKGATNNSTNLGGFNMSNNAISSGVAVSYNHSSLAANARTSLLANNPLSNTNDSSASLTYSFLHTSIQPGVNFGMSSRNGSALMANVGQPLTGMTNHFGAKPIPGQTSNTSGYTHNVFSGSYCPSTFRGSNMDVKGATTGIRAPSGLGGSPVRVASRKKEREKQSKRANASITKLKPADTSIGPLKTFARPVQGDTKSDEDCAICLENLSSPSDYDLTSDLMCSNGVLELLQCHHMFHRICLQRLFDAGTSQNDCLRCPTCNTIHGVMKGNQPEGGTMTVTTSNSDIPGYPGSGSIIITYSFSSGIQGSNHPSPGQAYSANSFPRTCYLPNNYKGQKVLKLLKIAFDRKLVFTIGRSVTTGQDNTIVWNDIHHKTEGYGNGSGYGYPDANYLDNVLGELASHGVTDM